VRITLLLFVFVFAAYYPAIAQNSFPEVTHYEAPAVYPPAARAVRAQGEVSVAVEVDPTGKVVGAQATSGHPLLRKVSELAVMKWQFSSTTGKHFLTLNILFRDPDSSKEKPGMKVIGPYRIKFTGPYYVILNTVNYSASANEKH
jgi:TonB family protein